MSRKNAPKKPPDYLSVRRSTRGGALGLSSASLWEDILHLRRGGLASLLRTYGLHRRGAHFDRGRMRVTLWNGRTVALATEKLLRDLTCKDKERVRQAAKLFLDVLRPAFRRYLLTGGMDRDRSRDPEPRCVWRAMANIAHLHSRARLNNMARASFTGELNVNPAATTVSSIEDRIGTELVVGLGFGLYPRSADPDGLLDRIGAVVAAMKCESDIQAARQNRTPGTIVLQVISHDPRAVEETLRR